LRLNTRTNSRISTLNGELVEKVELNVDDVVGKDNVEDEWKKVKFY